MIDTMLTAARYGIRRMSKEQNGLTEEHRQN